MLIIHSSGENEKMERMQSSPTSLQALLLALLACVVARFRGLLVTPSFTDRCELQHTPPSNPAIHSRITNSSIPSVGTFLPINSSIKTSLREQRGQSKSQWALQQCPRAQLTQNPGAAVTSAKGDIPRSDLRKSLSPDSDYLPVRRTASQMCYMHSTRNSLHVAKLEATQRFAVFTKSISPGGHARGEHAKPHHQF
jgi:hypothetical protein